MSAWKPSGKPIRLGLIGCGGIVKSTHLPCYLALPEAVQVVAVADPVPENRDEVGAALGVPPPQRYPHHSDLLAKAEVDVVTVATPHHLHAAHVIAAAEAGVAVISEKPMATCMEEAHAIRAAVQRHGVPYTIVHNLLHSPAMQEALAQISAGKLGQPYFARGQSLFNKGARATQTAANWRNARASGGGSISDTAYHEIYSVEALIGSPVRSVQAQVRTMFFDVDVDDIALLVMEHENGALSTVSTAWCVPTPAAESGRWCEVHATEGSLRIFHGPEGPFLRYTRDKGWQPIALPEAGRAAPMRHGGHLGYFAAVFATLAEGVETPTTVDTACHTLAIVEAARRATLERRAVDVRALEKP